MGYFILQRPAGFSFPAKYLDWRDWLIIAVGWCAGAFDFVILLWAAGLALGLPIGKTQ